MPLICQVYKVGYLLQKHSLVKKFDVTYKICDVDLYCFWWDDWRLLHTEDCRREVAWSVILRDVKLTIYGEISFVGCHSSEVSALSTDDQIDFQCPQPWQWDHELHHTLLFPILLLFFSLTCMSWMFCTKFRELINRTVAVISELNSSVKFKILCVLELFIEYIRWTWYALVTTIVSSSRWLRIYSVTGSWWVSYAFFDVCSGINSSLVLWSLVDRLDCCLRAMVSVCERTGQYHFSSTCTRGESYACLRNRRYRGRYRFKTNCFLNIS